MSAWLWIASPRKWRSAAGLSALDALHQYVLSDYVYWATPILQEVAVNEPSYIWLTEHGIVAVGFIAEPPRFYTGDNARDFLHPRRLEALGWDESRATSLWKTGIHLQHHRWANPVLVHFQPGFLRGKTVVRLDAQQHRNILRALGERGEA
jgi:hypothetical protein